MEAGQARREAYARLDAPDRVEPGAEFELKVGLAEAPSPDVVQAVPFSVPQDAFTLSIRVIAGAFQLRGGGGLERTLEVSPDDPFPYETLRLVALNGDYADRRSILAEYTVDGRLLGHAIRIVLVAPEIATVVAEEPTAAPAGHVWVLPNDDAPRPDLEITVAAGNDAAGVVKQWTCRTRHADVAVPGQLTRALPGTSDWARDTFRSIEEKLAKGDDDVSEFLLGVAGDVARAIPPEIWAVIDAVAADGKPPSILLATDEAYVPWELAWVERPWIADAPQLLGAQATVGRWIHSTAQRTASPPTELELGDMAVIGGTYEDNDLPEAKKEAELLVRDFGATTVEATARKVLDCVKGSPEYAALHFAVHGAFTTSSATDGLIMTDGRVLPRLSIQGAAQEAVSRRRPPGPGPTRMTFLNACQVGQGRQVLGRYTGLAEVFVALGAGAVIAPLWTVDDLVAREVAEAFYSTVLGTRAIPPAEQLRRERVATLDAVGEPAGSRLAYLYFGHPNLRVTWTGPRRGGNDA